MSEFKFACPVCGQHMMCDTSQGGSIMECPTCFQKIVAPQAPAPDAKFILTGSLYVEKKIPGTLQSSSDLFRAQARKALPFWLFALVILLFAGVVVFFFGKNLRELLTGPSWRGQDIGAVGTAGSFSRAKGVFTITGSGADTWRRQDSFQFVFHPLHGDGTLTAHVLNLKNTHEWAKAGVMIRATTNADSMFALSAVRPDGQVQFIWRKRNGAEAASSSLTGGTGYPKWIRIVRQGNTFTAYWKAHAIDEWQSIGASQKIKMPLDAQIGLVVCAHDAGVLSQAQFDQVTLQAHQKPPN